jgi:hypothetical protein
MFTMIQELNKNSDKLDLISFPWLCSIQDKPCSVQVVIPTKQNGQLVQVQISYSIGVTCAMAHQEEAKRKLD